MNSRLHMASQEHILLSTEQYKRLIDRIPKSEDLETDSDQKENLKPDEQSNLDKRLEDKIYSNCSQKDSEKIADVKNPDSNNSSNSSNSNSSSSNSSSSSRSNKGSNKGGNKGSSTKGSRRKARISSSRKRSSSSSSSSSSIRSPRVEKKGAADARKPKKKLTKEEIKRKFLLPGTRHPGNFENTNEGLRLAKQKWAKL